MLTPNRSVLTCGRFFKIDYYAYVLIDYMSTTHVVIYQNFENKFFEL